MRRKGLSPPISIEYVLVSSRYYFLLSFCHYSKKKTKYYSGPPKGAKNIVIPLSVSPGCCKILLITR